MRRGSWWRDALTVLLALAGLSGAQPAPAGELLTPQRQVELRHLLDHDCGSCHGLTRRGGLGPALSATALSDRDDDFLIDTILLGRRGTPMAPWGSELTREDARWLVDRMRGR
ncbi:MAG: cytochrome c [Alphaproteobacteria bacterium]|nr:cytochrome c [Alphaproteobacteria bacterium]